eukprot:1681323-Rhodomonas_salina.2
MGACAVFVNLTVCSAAESSPAPPSTPRRPVRAAELPTKIVGQGPSRCLKPGMAVGFGRDGPPERWTAEVCSA